MNHKLNNVLLIVVILTTTLFIIGLLGIERTTPPPPISLNPPVAPSEPPPPPSQKFNYEDALASINKEKLSKDVHFLASDELEGRMAGKKGNDTATVFLGLEFADYGLKVDVQSFPIARMNPGPKNEIGKDTAFNIIAWLPGNDPLLKDEIVVIGAHMDHIGYGPRMSRTPNRREIHNGADDNASGTAALLAIAKACSMLKGQNKRTISFQAYNAEEMGLIGSRYYCNNPLLPEGKPDIKKHVAMINMDMIGYLGKGHYFAGFHEGDSSLDIGRYINDLNQKYSFAKRITSRGTGGSDHANFYNKKIPVAFLHTGSHRHYHTPDDTAEKLNYSGMEQISKYAFELTWKIAQADAAPRFNHAEFKPMEVIHDHGNPEMPHFHSHVHPHR